MCQFKFRQHGKIVFRMNDKRSSSKELHSLTKYILFRKFLYLVWSLGVKVWIDKVVQCNGKGQGKQQ